MNILLTGSNGLLGGEIKNFFSVRNHTIYPVNYKFIDEDNKESILNKILDNDIVIHCAANTDLEFCEKNFNQCYQDNFLITKLIAEVCKKVNKKLVFISSTGVYGDYKKTPYSEFDETFPTNNHHKLKLEAEKFVLSMNSINLILRVGWLFGGDISNKRNFVIQRLVEAKQRIISGESLFVNKTQYGCPTYTKDICNRLYIFLNSREEGVFNLVNEGFASRADYVKEILEGFGLEISLDYVNKSFFNRVAKVSDNEMAINRKSIDLGYEMLPHWKESLSHYISSLDQSQLTK